MTTITDIQELKLSIQRKDSNWVCSRGFHLRRRTKVRGITCLDNIIYHTSPELTAIMRAKYDRTCVDFWRNHVELAQYSTLVNIVCGAYVRDVVAPHVNTKRNYIRTRYGYGKVESVQDNYRSSFKAAAE